MRRVRELPASDAGGLKRTGRLTDRMHETLNRACLSVRCPLCFQRAELDAMRIVRCDNLGTIGSDR